MSKHGPTFGKTWPPTPASCKRIGSNKERLVMHFAFEQFAATVFQQWLANKIVSDRSPVSESYRIRERQREQQRGRPCPTDNEDDYRTPLGLCLGTRPVGNAGGHRCRQRRDGGPGRKPVGLSATAAAAAADPGAIYGAGINGAARYIRRVRPRRTHSRAVWCWMGVAIDGRLDGGDNWLTRHRIHRRGGDRRTLRPVAQSHLASCRGGSARRRRHRLLPTSSSGSQSSSACSNSPFLPSLGPRIPTPRPWSRTRSTYPFAIVNFCIWRRRLSERSLIRG